MSDERRPRPRMMRRRSETFTETTLHFPEPPSDDLDDRGLGSGVPRRPPDSSGSASAANTGPKDPKSARDIPQP